MTSTPQAGSPPPGRPRPRKGGLGCVVGAVTTGVVAFVLVWVVGAFFVRVARTQREIVRRGAAAPGTAELRALGCDPGSTVMEVRQSWSLADGGPPVETRAFIACLATEGAAVPSCDDVARTYARAAGRPGGAFVAQVRVVRRFRIECERAYREDGTGVGDVAP